MISQAERQLYISVAEEFHRDLSDEWLEQVLRLALEQALPPEEPGQVSLLVTDDATVRELNRVYRGLDEVTDVLSFSATHQGHWEGDEEPPSVFTAHPELVEGPPVGGSTSSPRAESGLPPDEDRPADEEWPDFVLPPDELPPLGEIIVSYPQTRRQAEALDRPVDRELALLIVHGALHLVGHDHVEPEDTARMQAREQAALAALFEAQGERI